MRWFAALFRLAIVRCDETRPVHTISGQFKSGNQRLRQGKDHSLISDLIGQVLCDLSYELFGLWIFGNDDKARPDIPIKPDCMFSIRVISEHLVQTDGKLRRWF